MLKITELSDAKKIVWLERGNSNAGFEHILKHAEEFAKHGTIVGYQGRGTGRPIYEFIYKGEKKRVAITVGNNGFIVGANPVSLK